MKSLICGVSMLALFVAAGLISQRADAADESASVETVMKTLFAGKTSPLNTLKAAVKSETPDWAKIKDAAGSFAKHGPALGENDPPQGEKDSWVKLTKALADESKALDDAAGKKDLDGVNASIKKIGASCKSCHEVHRPE